ncbi:hypothetical protein CCM_03134 [Cordyceps militaris CM01]|uniref:Uncharacterized protein n=1 Tax=Cordyceps militaris (strain CM01) TaxID=983644 RepID=G3J8Y0_CORMM|nr:uncharacterized protein CCM_03134 [Cordyceps militaris CM01]EGX94863.1 hypothetical protein CCM_03134 [Cordyceps militaris CM01]
MLCSHRAEGFSTHSTQSSPIPTSCFVDAILVPLPVWIALTALVVLLLVPKHLITGLLAAEPRRHQQPSWLYRIIAGTYYVLILCNILMHTLEIVRLSLIHFGIALLPFAYVGLLLGAALHWSRGAAGRVSAWLLVNMVVWLGGMVMSIVKVIGLDGEDDLRKGSKYPMSDQVLDVAVIAGVYGAIAALELVMGLWRRRNHNLLK